MSLVLGVDTGGTYTDAVIVKSGKNEILEKAKAFTTHADLKIGIDNCLNRLDKNLINQVEQVNISTTVAVNAILENNFEDTGILMIGKTILDRLPARYLYSIKNPFTHHNAFLTEGIKEIKDIYRFFNNRVSNIIITSDNKKEHFEQERIVAEIVSQELVGCDIIPASEQSGSSDYVKRTVEAALKVFLKPLVASWIKCIRKSLYEKGIGDELYIVNAMGDLVTCEQAVCDPLSLIYSGLATSVKGGIALAGIEDFLLVDMGGTSSDVTKVSGGRLEGMTIPIKVGGFKIDKEAMNVKSYGVGGDSCIRINQARKIKVGPEKAMPICVAAHYHRDITDELCRYKCDVGYEMITAQQVDCYISYGIDQRLEAQLTYDENKIVEYVSEHPHNILQIGKHFGKDPDSLHMDRLLKLNAVDLISMTPTDILHISNRYNEWDAEASHAAAEIMRRQIASLKSNL